jgi:hypothetical protein
LTHLVTNRTVGYSEGREEFVMKNLLRATGGVSGAAALVLTSVALGSTSGKQTAEKSLIVIRERASAVQSGNGTYKGRFSLLLNGVITDSGTSIIRPSLGTAKPVDGQPQAPVSAYNSLRSKIGTLILFFHGVSIVVGNLDPTKDPYESEYGTWQIQEGSGKYTGWKGGGRWLNVAPPGANYIEWDGYVTH